MKQTNDLESETMFETKNGRFSTEVSEGNENEHDTETSMVSFLLFICYYT